jgi:hypothetical protein
MPMMISSAHKTLVHYPDETSITLGVVGARGRRRGARVGQLVASPGRLRRRPQTGPQCDSTRPVAARFRGANCADLLESGRRIIEHGQDRLRSSGSRATAIKRRGASRSCAASPSSSRGSASSSRSGGGSGTRQEHDSVLSARRSLRERAKRACTATYGRPRGKVTDAGGSCSTHVPPMVRVLHPGIRQAESIGP